MRPERVTVRTQQIALRPTAVLIFSPSQLVQRKIEDSFGSAETLKAESRLSAVRGAGEKKARGGTRDGRGDRRVIPFPAPVRGKLTRLVLCDPSSTSRVLRRFRSVGRNLLQNSEELVSLADVNRRNISCEQCNHNYTTAEHRERPH